MPDRFLEYSLKYQRPIRAVWLEGGRLTQKTVRVVGISGGEITLRAGRKKPFVISRADMLGCEYARGDHGEE